MPCMCWYEPDDKRKKHLKSLCQDVVNEIKLQNSLGDPEYFGHDGGVEYVSKLIRHLYRGGCDEKQS